MFKFFNLNSIFFSQFQIDSEESFHKNKKLYALLTFPPNFSSSIAKFLGGKKGKKVFPEKEDQLEVLFRIGENF